jgi:G:T-mismatch repair DNA endonuclease (very short patch repair protein)
VTLQEIIHAFNKKSWLRLCTLNGIDKWSLIAYLNESVFAGKHFIIPGLEVATTQCLHCGSILDLGFCKGYFIAIKRCNCEKDGTTMSFSKLSCVLTEEKANRAIELVNLAKRQGLTNTREYWINKGMTHIEAGIAVSEVQKERSAKSPASQKGAKGYSMRTVEYWIKKGFTPVESLVKLKQAQTTNGLEFYVAKFGKAGIDLFNARIEKWLNAEGNRKMITGRSKRSLLLFESLGCGSYGVNEKTVRGLKKVHRVDFISGKKIIEFYGDYWHGNPTIYNGDVMIRKKKIKEVWAHDKSKVQDLIDNGYDVLIVWENEYTHTPEEVTQNCKDFIK